MLQAGLMYMNELWRPGVTISSSSEVPSWEASNLLDIRTNRKWRTQNTVTADFTVEFPSPGVSIDVLSAIFPRITNPRYSEHFGVTQWCLPTDQIQHTLDPVGGTAGAGALYDSGAINCDVDPTLGYHLHLLPSVETGVGFWKCSIECSSRTAENFFDLMNIMAGRAMRPEIRFSYNSNLTRTDLAEVGVVPGSGMRIPNKREKVLTWKGSFDHIYDAEYNQWFDFETWVGKSEPFLFWLREDGDLSRQCMQCMVAETTGISELTFDGNSKPLTLIEHR